MCISAAAAEHLFREGLGVFLRRCSLQAEVLEDLVHIREPAAEGATEKMKTFGRPAGDGKVSAMGHALRR